MENNSARNPTAGLSGPPYDPTQMVTPARHPRQSDSLLDSEKTGAALLFSGLFLTLVGITFTAMSWQHYLANPTVEWIQLLGPILISVGGTFILTSVCKFRIISCWPCRRRDEVLVMPVEQTSTGHSFTLSGINQPIMLQGATTMLCIPPVYNVRTQEICQAIEFQPGRSVNAVDSTIRPCDAVSCVAGAAFIAEDSSTHSTEIDHRRSRIEKAEGERGRGDDSSSTCSHPPAYEDIYPSFSKRNLT
ncbi:transmembrane protein 174 [Morone saxatilis]|uniref:transmembrane protein 174 n=1 Tax=Morone saxatilis TaxID=34816 RepID=UPI0015E205E7|nr:transmembrane protein 174 [Morone saxatilis]